MVKVPHPSSTRHVFSLLLILLDLQRAHLWSSDAGYEHVLRKPALAPGHGTAKPEGQTLLAQQRVAAVAGAKTEDLQGVGLVGNYQLLWVTRPLNLEQMSDVSSVKNNFTNLCNTRMEWITNAVKTLTLYQSQ